jgi:hypothetical protein
MSRRGCALVAIVCGCSSETAPSSPPHPEVVATKDGGSAGSASPDPTPRPTTGGPAEVMAWLPKDASQAWQGAWLTKLALRDGKTSSFTGTYVALEITGDKARAWDASTQREHTLGVQLDKPCAITFTESDGQGGTSYFHKRFVIEHGTVLAGGGGTGYRKGKAAIVCMNDDVFLLDDKGTCKQWVENFGKWEVKDAKCAWTQDQPTWAGFEKTLSKDTLNLRDADMSDQLVARGDILTNIHFRDALTDKDHHREQDYESAKAAARKRFQETDPLERAKTAGGKVGETSTIISVHATFISDKAALKGKPIEVTGRFASVKQTDQDGKPEWQVSVVDAADLKAKDWELVCRSPKPVTGFKPGDKLTVKGTVGEWWDRPAVVGCAVRR